MIAWEKLFYGLCVGSILAGVEILITWSHTSKLLGLVLVLVPLSLLYMHTKQKKNSDYTSKINLYRSCLGFILILIDIAYNLYVGDAFRSLDYGILSIGFVIILLNMNLLWFLQLDEEMASVLTYFFFIFVSIYAFLFEGIGIVFSNAEHPLLVPMTQISIRLSVFLLNFIAPTTIYESGDWRGINFNGFEVGIATACSGIQSITVFLSAILAYFIANKNFGIKKTAIYTAIGMFILFLMNVLRIMMITMVGYYKGGEAMLFAHANLGWILFVLAMALFWYLITRED
jgi:archaeosortase C (PEF-CTERM variant)